jgi:NAD(P)-dependent dehydrogenase (short-subunit alcohol dehydrogenase family)
MVRVLITEAHEGLGLALVKEYLADGDNQVIAFCGDDTKCDQLNTLKENASNKQLLIVPVNLADEESIKASVKPIEGFVDALDLLIFNTGFIPDGFLDIDVVVSDISEYAFRSYARKIFSSQQWLRDSMLTLLKSGDKSKVVGIHLCMPRPFDSSVVNSLIKKGNVMISSVFSFNAFAIETDPNLVTVIHTTQLDRNRLLEPDICALMENVELVSKEAIDEQAKVLNKNIPKLPHGIHYINYVKS